MPAELTKGEVEELDETAITLFRLLHEEGLGKLSYELRQSSDQSGEYYPTVAVIRSDGSPLVDLLNPDKGDWSETTLALFCAAINALPALLTLARSAPSEKEMGSVGTSPSPTDGEGAVAPRAVHYPEADALEFVMRDVPIVERSFACGLDVLLDMDTREPIGWRIISWSKICPDLSLAPSEELVKLGEAAVQFIRARPVNGVVCIATDTAALHEAARAYARSVEEQGEQASISTKMGGR